MVDNRVSKIILGTGSYANLKTGNVVSITGDGGNAWGFYGPAYKKLAPRLVTYLPYAEGYEDLVKLRDDLTRLKEYLVLRKQIEDQYIKSFYETRLKELDVYELLDILESKFGKDIILTCHEDIDEFCHRRLIADYIELETGVYIPEVVTDSNGMVLKKKPIRYKNRLKAVMER